MKQAKHVFMVFLDVRSTGQYHAKQDSILVIESGTDIVGYPSTITEGATANVYMAEKHKV